MSRQSYETNIRNLITTIFYCFKNNQLLGPGLILLYSGIDIMAWLNCPEHQEDVDKEAFIQWVDKYLLPNSSLSCSAIDLYAARCGMVHSFSSVSRLFREDKANEIWYARGKKATEMLQNHIKSTKKDSIIVIDFEKFFSDYIRAVEKFDQYLLNNTQKASIVYKRADKLFASFIPLLEREKKEGG